jgi:TolA-binding protein
MSVVDLHPEDLLDRASRATLSDAESQRLEAHVAVCAACRFELRARRDFAELPLALPVPLLVPSNAPQQVAREVGSRRPRAKRSKRPLWFLAVAALLTTGASLGAWLSQELHHETPHPAASPPSVAPGAARHASAHLAPTHDDPNRMAPPANPPALRLDALPLAPTPVTSAAPAERSASHHVDPTPPSSAVERTPATVRSVSANRVVRSSRAAAGEGPVAVGSTGGNASPSPKAAEGPAELFRAANQARRDGNAPQAVELYRALQSRFPSSDEAHLSRATLAQLMLDRGEAGAALDGFDQYLAQNGTVLGEEALVGRALALGKLGNRSAEIAAWKEVLRRYPDSVHARLARSRLGALGEQ